jgi:HK97 family phage portal protein
MQFTISPGVPTPHVDYRSLENPSTPLSDPDEWLYEALGGEKTDTGVRVNRKTALTSSAIYRAVNMISTDVARVPLLVFERLITAAGDGKKLARDHRAYQLLRYRPSAQMTDFTWKQTKMGHVLTRGNGYSYVMRDGAANPIELLLLNPDVTYPVRANGVLFYVTEITVNGKKETRKLPAADVLHWKGLGFDGLVGYDLVAYAKQCIGMDLAARKHGSLYFKRGGAPRVVLEHPGRLGDEARTNLRKSWESMYEGIDNAHRAAILEEGLKLNAFGFNLKDSQLLELRQFDVREVANFWGVPPHRLGDNSRQGYNSLEQENDSYVFDSLDGWFCMIESDSREKMLSEREKADDTHLIQFDRRRLMLRDSTAKSNYYRVGLGGRPFMTQNEVRDLEDLNPDPDPKANQILEPLNMGQGGNDGADNQPKDAKPQRDAVRQVLADALRRVIRRVRTDAQKSAKRPDKFLAELRALPAEHLAVVTTMLQPALALIDVAAEPFAERFLRTLVTRIGKRVGDNPNGHLVEDLETFFTKAEASWPTRLADRRISQK